MEEKAKERLPIEKRAELLASEESLFFNIAKFEHAQRVAELFAKSTMVPDHFRGNIGNCIIAFNYAMRIKIDPFMCMQCMYVVHGRPGIEGKLVAGLLNSSGKYKDPVKYRWVDGNDQEVAKRQVYNGKPEKIPDHGCIAYATDAKSGETVEGPKISWKIVKAEGWCDKPGPDKKITSNKWRTMPELMFMYRAVSWFANTNCPEIKMGMMTTEEAEDIIDLRRQSDGSYGGDSPAEIKQKIEDLETKLGKPQGKAPDPEEEAKNKAASAAVDSTNLNSDGFMAEPETETPPVRSVPGVSEIPTVWERVNWINLKTPGFAGHVWQNLESFSGLPTKLQAKIISKWHNHYDEPFPQHQIEPETEQEDTGPGSGHPLKPEPEIEGKEPETEETEETGPEDAESAERAAMITQMKEYPEDIQFKAKALLTMVTGHGAWPPTLDGCNLLVEKMAELMKE